MKTSEELAKQRLEREWGDRYEQDAKDEASAASSALERAALRVLDEARRSGSVTVKAREDLAEALGLPREAARGLHARDRARGGVAT